MGVIEEVSDDLSYGNCNSCQKHAETKCNACKQIFYCSRQCQKKDWSIHKSFCQSLPYLVKVTEGLGKYLVANRDLKEGEILWSEEPLSIGPTPDSIPVCLSCYAPVDGSYSCKKSGWPVCGPECEKAISRNAEVVVPYETTAEFQIDSYDEPCYLYDSISTLRILLMQKSAPKRYSKILALESHLEDRRKALPPTAWNRTQERIIDVIKKTYGIMVFEAICPEYNFGDELIQRIAGILETNAIEIRLAASEVQALYKITCLLEHSCCPNIRMTFDDKFRVTVRAGRNIPKGEHLSFMYTHSLWGTASRREHLYLNKFFWCQCKRCQDPTEFGSHFSTIIREGKELLQRNPLDSECSWTSEDESISVSCMDVRNEMSVIGAELAILQLKGTVEEYITFIDKYEAFLHPNHYHLMTAKHSLLQMLGRTEGYLIQDLPEKLLELKENLCRKLLEVCKLIDPSGIRLQIYSAVALFELHLPLLQIAKRKWENGELPTSEFRETLKEPRDHLDKALSLLKDETNEKLPEGVMRIQVKETLEQLDKFMVSVGCE